MVDPLRLKAFALRDQAVEWEPDAAHVTVRPRESMTLFVEGRVKGELLLAVRAVDDPSGSGRFATVLDLSRLARPWQVVLTSSGWRQDDAGAQLGDDATGVRVWACGTPVGSTEAGGPDRRLSDQLRALGYLQ